MSHPSLGALLGRRLQGKIASVNPMGYGFVELDGSTGMQFIFNSDPRHGFSVGDAAEFELDASGVVSSLAKLG